MKKDYTIAQVDEMLRELKENILAGVQVFEEKTGLEVDDIIQLERMGFVSGAQPVSDVSITVTIEV